MSTTENETVHQSALTTESVVEKTAVVLERLDTLDSPNNNNNTSASSSLKNERVASGLLKMLEDDSILQGFEDLPPSDNLLDDEDPEIYGATHLSGIHSKRAGSNASMSGDGSFVHTHSDVSDNEEESPLQFHNERQFELEFKLHEAEQKVEQLNLQLKGKSMQLEQVQVALISYEEEIMQLRQHMTRDSDGSCEEEETPKHAPPASSSAIPSTPIGSVSLETAEQLSSKIIKLQQRVEELEDIMVYTKLDNAQLKETTEFLKSKLKQYTKKGAPTEKKAAAAATTAKSSSVRNLFARK